MFKKVGIKEILSILGLTLGIILTIYGIYLIYFTYITINEGPYEHPIIIGYIAMFLGVGIIFLITSAILFYLIYRFFKKRKNNNYD
jgi:uncharacterized BrkB/YihY/UPF0761 family membrane protein